MTTRELAEKGLFETVNTGDVPRQIKDVFCCDLLSIAMSRGPEGAAWVTVIGNVNTLAVMDLADMACVILAEGTRLDEPALEKARENGFAVFMTEAPVFTAARMIYELIQEEES